MKIRNFNVYYVPAQRAYAAAPADAPPAFSTPILRGFTEGFAAEQAATLNALAERGSVEVMLGRGHCESCE